MGFVYLILKHHALHHICIITMFHAFRCVFTLLQCCVLVSLDWAEPMMYFNLHVTHSCISMHTYLQVFIFLYILSCWCFMILSLSLSLYLSFLLSLFLASVASWHPNANPLHPRTLFFLGILTFQKALLLPSKYGGAFKD